MEPLRCLSCQVFPMTAPGEALGTAQPKATFGLSVITPDCKLCSSAKEYRCILVSRGSTFRSLTGDLAANAVIATKADSSEERINKGKILPAMLDSFQSFERYGFLTLIYMFVQKANSYKEFEKTRFTPSSLTHK
jgi:hypothetical protein